MSQDEVDDEKLAVWTKIAYAVGDLAHSVGREPSLLLVFILLTDVAHLNPALAGITVIVGGAWDTVNDPLIGWLSDRTRTRWGRRRTYLLFGAVLYGIMFALM